MLRKKHDRDERKETMAVQSPQDLFFYDLCAMYDVERKLVQVLPELAKESQDRQVSEAFLQHQQETEHHVQNLEQCFQILSRSPLKLESHTVAGLKEDHDAFVAQQPSPQALTLFDIAAGSKSEYLEIAAYQHLIQEANVLGLQSCIPLFQQNLQQEEAAARKLAGLAQQLGQQQAHAH
jgi:ferritin-like metal-binding protein YciE